VPPPLPLEAWVHPDVDPALLSGPAVEEGKRLLGRLLDPDLLGLSPGLPDTPVYGTCRICTTDQTMTFEHIPPRSASNDQRAKAIPVHDMLTREADIDFPRNGWTPSQRGAGAYVLCADCNNHCGRLLVPEYSALALTVGQTVSGAITTGPDGMPSLPRTIDLNLTDFALGNVARQAVAMLLGVSGGAAVARLHPELPRLVRGEQAELPDSLVLGLALAGGSRIRHTSPHLLAGEHGTQVGIEVAAAPFRWTLSWTGQYLVPAKDTTDVTEWLRHPIDERREAQVELLVGMIIGATPGDDRDAASILQGRYTPDATD